MSLWLWALFVAGILALLLFDLGLVSRRAHVVSMREALLRTAFFVVLGLSFSAVVYQLYEHHGFGAGTVGGAVADGRSAAVAYLTAFLLEESLSLDNIFVMALIFTYFQVPREHRQRVLFWGILGALVLRGVMIVVGAAAIRRFSWIIYVFGALLILSAIKMLRSGEETLEPARNPLVRLTRRLFPVTDHYHGERFFVREGGRVHATPMFVTLVMIESTDVLFAVDSIPAAFAVTSDPFLVFTANVFAILGLRSLYFALEGLLHRFRYLKLSLVIVLAYIGVKMLLSHVWPIPNQVSLIVVVTALVVGVFASMARDEAAAAVRHARRLVILVVGGTVLLLGMVMMITPGPGVIGILAGLTILAAEFAWARRLLRRTHDAIGGMMPQGMRERLRAWFGGGPEEP